ncbi:uncharacterized protein LOC135714160 [Ochlerotatus camptorhynchus]|uniref:uncharacterized protein LOC135714160 n=1 Tax=Ochlerotatus camptorhynchus TaxID=644619 RepID=UPI0031DB66D4
MVKFWEIEDVRLGSTLSVAEAAVEQLPDELLHQRQHFLEELPAINQKQKQRFVVLSNTTWIELHGFSDASMRAYGSVVYIRSITAEGTIEVNLVASKSRVAPLKPVTIPRLEFCGAKLLAELVQMKSPLALNQFVANRVTAVLELSPGYTWNYIRSEENPADAISRGKMQIDLVNKKLRWNCLSMLWKQAFKTDEPEELEESVLSDIRQARVLAAVRSEPPMQFNRVSDYRKLQRAWAYVMRFIDMKKEKDVISVIKSVTAEEMMKAEKVIVRLIQQETFSDHLKLLRSRSGKRHNLLSLAPFVGEDHLIGVGGRLKYSAIPYDGKHQMLLPEKHYVAEILIRKLHEEHHPVGQGGLLAFVLERYWPVKASKNTVIVIIAITVINVIIVHRVHVLSQHALGTKAVCSNNWE